MKNVNTVLHAVSLVAIAVLFFVVFKKNTPGNTVPQAAGANTGGKAGGAIAYFEMDSVEHNYKYIKDVQDQLKSRQQDITNELADTKKQYMGRVQQLQEKAKTMSQQEGEAAQAEINQMQLELQNKEGRLNQELQEQQFKLMQDINKRIETYLATYNNNGRYAYIFSHSTGDFIYFKDSANNITNDIINGLNSNYKKPQ